MASAKRSSIDGNRLSVPRPIESVEPAEPGAGLQPANRPDDGAARVVGVVDEIADAVVFQRLDAEAPEVFLRIVPIDGLHTQLDAILGEVGQREVRLQHLIVPRRDAGAEQHARVTVEEVVAPPAAEADASADGLPPEPVLQVEAVVRRDLAERIDVLDPEHGALELAALVGCERLGLLGSLLCERRLAGVLREDARGLRESASAMARTVVRRDIDPERYRRQCQEASFQLPTSRFQPRLQHRDSRRGAGR